LPGNTQFEDIDDFLVTVGNQNDSALVHSFASKLFKVPQRMLLDAEKDREGLTPKSVLDAVQSSRRRAKDAAAAAGTAESSSSVDTNDNNWPRPSRTLFPMDKTDSSIDDDTEYADPNYLCDDCLPIYGDEIVGTKPKKSQDDTSPKVHRVCCPHALRAINRASAENKRPAADMFKFELGRVDSVSLRRRVQGRVSKEPPVVEVPVKIRWSDFNETYERRISFLCEVVVLAQDRKHLLTDCSEIVSDLSEIVKTGSQTIDEYASLVFLVKVQNLDHLQKLMDSLRQLRSVMAVERRVRKFCWYLVACLAVCEF
jgi:(p)ppGpp synthase/HD superfamily hydrolase